MANVLFKVKNINSTGDMLCFLTCSVERNEVQCNQGTGGRKGRAWAEGKIAICRLSESREAARSRMTVVYGSALCQGNSPGE